MTGADFIVWLIVGLLAGSLAGLAVLSQVALRPELGGINSELGQPYGSQIASSR